jgi:hypothetical protein
MTLRSPIVAMLWELWRLTRAEIAWKLALPIGVGVTALLLGAAFGPPRYQDVANINDAIAAFALIIIVLPQLVPWMSIAKLNGSQPGFPFYLAYTRPVRTSVIVGLPMTYFTAVSSAMYLVSAIVLRVTSGYAFPLLPVAAWLAALSWVGTAAAWSTRNKVVQVCVTMFALVEILVTGMDRLTAVEIPDNFDWPPRLWPTLFDFPRTDYAWIALIGLASFGVTVSMVTRQRRGDPHPLLAAPRAIAGVITRTPDGGLWDWLVGLFRVPCPTSSATRAQVWLDLKSNGMPVLTIGMVLAIVILLVSAVSGPIDASINADPDVKCPIAECFYVRSAPPLFLTPLSLITVFFFGGNAFGIRWRQGRTYVSPFEATQAYGTASLAILKLLVKSACVLAGLIAIAVSFWISIPLLGDAVFVQIWGVPLASRRAVFTDAFAALAAYEQLALAVVAAVGVVVWVASWAALGALKTRYRRRINIAVCLLLVYGVLFVWLGVAVSVDPKTTSPLHLDVVHRAMRWIAAAATVSTTVYVFWSGFAEHVLTTRYVSGAVAISAAFAAAWLTVLHIAGVQLAGMSAMHAISVVWPALLPLMASGLAPWSYGRIRHT